MTQALLMHLVKKALDYPDLTDAEKIHIASVQLMCVLSTIDHHLGSIGDPNYASALRQVQLLIERERASGVKAAGLAKLIGLLIPLDPLTTKIKN